MPDSGNLPIKKRVYSLVIVREISEHPNGVRFSDLRRTLRISKPCLAYTLLDLKDKDFIEQSDTGLYRLTPSGREYLDRLGEDLESRMRSVVQFLIHRTENRIKTQIKDERLLSELERFFQERIIEVVKEGADEVSRRSALLLESLSKPKVQNNLKPENHKDEISIQGENNDKR